LFGTLWIEPRNRAKENHAPRKTGGRHVGTANARRRTQTAPLECRGTPRHAALLRAAKELSIEQGVSALSLDAVIKRAVGSRRSIYTEFGGKEGLREALMTEISTEILSGLAADAAQESDLRAMLKRYARNLASALTSAHNIARIRIVLQNIFHSPERARRFLEQGPGGGARLLSGWLEAARERGEIDVRDCLAAANLFIVMVRGNLYFERILQLRPPPGEEEIEAHVDSVVDIFLNGLRPR
jgi:AcrR family transcriptional regulator